MSPPDEPITREVVLAALAAFPARRQRALLAQHGAAIAAIADVYPEGRLDALAQLAAQRALRAWHEHDATFPITRRVADGPCIVLGEGAHPEVLDAPRVAIVGTRAATPHGLADAREVGAFLAGAGCTIVSGLALGIDAAAHEGALAVGGRVIGVIGTGLDVVYPRRHTRLYQEVRDAGMLLSEYGYGAPPERWRFPERNRIIAALADVVVVIEATLTGGACVTARKAQDYDRPLFALPGSRRNVAAAGCNQLLADGALPLLDPSDVLAALQLAAGGQLRAWSPAQEQPPSRDAASVLHALGGEPATTDELAARTRLEPDRLGPALRELQRLRRIDMRRGRYWPM